MFKFSPGMVVIRQKPHRIGFWKVSVGGDNVDKPFVVKSCNYQNLYLEGSSRCFTTDLFDLVPPKITSLEGYM